MKKYLLALICTVLTVSTVSAGPVLTDLKIYGNFLNEKAVTYEVCEVNTDMSRTIVETRTKVFHYSIRLEVGTQYIITFTKDDKIKILYITVNQTGIAGLDVNFNSDCCAELKWHQDSHKYKTHILNKTKYSFTGDHYVENN